VTQHITTKKHLRGVNYTENEKTKLSNLFQKLNKSIKRNSSSKSLFNNDLCKVMLSANIPLHKLSNSDLSNESWQYTLISYLFSTNVEILPDIF